jgi:hypothetical protein
MLFYESAACLHGRRQVFKGKYYASVFSHYQPVDRTIWNFTTEVRDMDHFRRCFFRPVFLST